MNKIKEHLLNHYLKYIVLFIISMGSMVGIVYLRVKRFDLLVGYYDAFSFQVLFIQAWDAYPQQIIMARLMASAISDIMQPITLVIYFVRNIREWPDMETMLSIRQKEEKIINLILFPISFMEYYLF